MTWTILVLVLGIALYMFGGMMLKHDAKKPAMGAKLVKKAIKVIAIIMVAGSVCRLYMPYYLTSVNPAIIQEMVEAMQEQLNEEKNKAVRRDEYARAQEIMDEINKLRQDIEKIQNDWKSSTNEKMASIGSDDVAKIVSAWTGIPVFKIDAGRKRKIDAP